jgi:hypothetical protein
VLGLIIDILDEAERLLRNLSDRLLEHQSL